MLLLLFTLIVFPSPRVLQQTDDDDDDDDDDENDNEITPIMLFTYSV